LGSTGHCASHIHRSSLSPCPMPGAVERWLGSSRQRLDAARLSSHPRRVRGRLLTMHLSSHSRANGAKGCAKAVRDGRGAGTRRLCPPPNARDDRPSHDASLVRKMEWTDGRADGRMETPPPTGARAPVRRYRTPTGWLSNLIVVTHSARDTFPHVGSPAAAVLYNPCTAIHTTNSHWRSRRTDADDSTCGAQPDRASTSRRPSRRAMTKRRALVRFLPRRPRNAQRRDPGPAPIERAHSKISAGANSEARRRRRRSARGALLPFPPAAARDLQGDGADDPAREGCTDSSNRSAQSMD
jgi:hypothetical protein